MIFDLYLGIFQFYMKYKEVSYPRKKSDGPKLIIIIESSLKKGMSL